MPYKNFLGYKKGENGQPRVVEAEAAIVRLIYKMFLQGRPAASIKAFLEKNGIPSPSGKEQWHSSTILSILRNEKYKGDAILQKRFTVDFLTKKQKLNEGEVPQYYVENSHPAIVSAEVYDMAQAEFERRQLTNMPANGIHVFSSKIICGHCGTYYGIKYWHAQKERTVVWQCSNKYKQKGKHVCSLPHLYEDAIKKAFISVFNSFLLDREQLREDYELILEFLTDNTSAEKEMEQLQEECMVVMELLKKTLEENTATAQDQEDYRRRYDALAGRYEKAKTRLDELSAERQSRNARHSQIKSFLDDLLQQEAPLSEWNEEVWYSMVESVTVRDSKTLEFRFRDGSTVPYCLR